MALKPTKVIAAVCHILFCQRPPLGLWGFDAVTRPTRRLSGNKWGNPTAVVEACLHLLIFLALLMHVFLCY